MSEMDSSLQIRVYLLDGSTQTFIQTDPGAIEHTLTELHPASIFSQDRATIAEDGAAVSIVLPLITRIDLMTERLSVWDFPFVLGAPMEISEAEFQQGLLSLHEWEQPSSSKARPVFLELEMVDGQCVYLWIEVVAGVSLARLGKIHSLLTDRRLVFGLRIGGIGLLNLSNLAHFSVHPDPNDAAAETAAQDHLAPNTMDLERGNL